MFFNTDPLPGFNEKPGVGESFMHDRLSSMDRVFYAYDDDKDQVPFDLGSDDDVGYYNDIYDDGFETINCHSVNVDGTPFVGCSAVDVKGNVFGVTDDIFEDNSMGMFDDDIGCDDIFEDNSMDMFDDDIGCDDMFSDDTY
jgi:hypothetical protein